MNKHILFLNGVYRPKDIPFYKNLSRGAFRVAVDGGYAFFSKAGLSPDLVIGDLDSAGRIPKILFEKGKVLVFPVEKDRTDAQLAVEYSILSGARQIDLVMPSMTEPDHVLGAMMLLTEAGVRRWSKKGGRLRIRNRSFEMSYVVNSKLTISGAIGDQLSVVPLTDLKLTCTGTEYNCRSLAIRRGDSRPLRNRITAGRATVQVSGEAFVFHLFAMP